MPTAVSPLASCGKHPRATAGWRCVGCGTALCLDCVEARRMRTVDVLACRGCGDRAEPLRVHRAELHPLAGQLKDAWRYALTPRFGRMVLATATVLTVLTFMTQVTLIVLRLAPALLLAGVYSATFFAILLASARGERDVPLPEYSDLFSDWLLPALRGLLATSVVWLTPLLYLVYVSHWNVGAYTDRLLADPMFYMTGAFHALPWQLVWEDPRAWVLGLVCLGYLPMSLLLAASSPHPLDMLNPLRGVHAIRRLGADYGRTLRALAVLGVALLLSRQLGAALRGLPWGVFTRWLAEVVELPALFLGAHVLGLLLHTRGDALGYGDPRDYIVPVLGEAVPSTTLRVDGLGLPEAEPEETFHTAGQRLEELSAAVSARDVPRALELYALVSVLPRANIAPAVHLFVGQAAAAQGDLALSVKALERAADVAPDEPLAPRALVLLARVLGERMNEPLRAQEVYRYIVERYPETDASRFARSRIPPTT